MTLVELLIAMVIGLFLIITVVSVYVSTTTSSRFSVLSAQMNEDAALAIDLLQEQIRLGGFTNRNVAGMRNFSGVPLRGCDGGFTAATEDSVFAALACTGGNLPDAIAVRYEASSLNSPIVGDPARPANCVSNGIAPSIQAASGANISLADNRFYIANDGANAGIPTLFCRGSDGAATFSAQAALVPNIEDLQFRYSITRVPVPGQVQPHQVTATVDASDAALGNAEINWSRVAAVHICLVARSARPVPLGDNQIADVGRFVDCNDQAQQRADRFLRRSFRSTVYLRNARSAVPGAFALNGAIPLNPYRHLSSAD